MGNVANTSSRTLRLLSLLQTRRYWPGEELAGQLRVSPRTLRRDIDRLRELGYPIQAQRGVAGGYQLAAGSALPPLVVDDEEAVALAVGLQTAAQGAGAPGAVEGIAEASVRALAKGGQVMPARGRRRAGDRRPGGPHHPGPRLPGYRTGPVLVHRGRRRADWAERRTASPRAARPPLVPGRLRPGPAGLAELPAGPGPPAATGPGRGARPPTS